MTNIKSKRKSTYLICFLLSFVLIISCLSVPAFAVTQEEIDAVKAERDAIASQRDEQQAVVDSLVSEKASALQQKLALEERNALTRLQIELNTREIALYDEMILQKEQEVEEAKTREAEQLRRYRVRVRAMEENGTFDFIGLILNTTSFGELFSVLDDIGDIMESDKRLEREYIAAREHTETVKAEYEEYRASVQEKQVVLRQEQDELQAEIEAANAYIEELVALIEANELALEEMETALEAANAEVNSLIAQREAERAAAAAANRPSYAAANPVAGTGSFMWPCPSSTYITSRVGYRWHPVTGKWKNHNGLDIGAQSGATVLAADGGTVTIAYYYGGYGNCVMIDHGNGFYTLYGHLSSINVSTNQNVSKGECVGYVGSTGNSTGPHLHFEIRQGTVILNPEDFYDTSYLTYSADAGD